ncbi:hypothetical protein SISNIDRAFT_235330 [Sistotremastrum niveocremeum HHB9708]|uniref:Uncharacterized protein n=1 Tax=Sistotremastrum niveocremeum HHB9708 TaxID=1314777 RepID=A0A164PW71_9AGAM|nr:hypothetical protein SISNIDRAFT_235330 [Sistotremastrum niveocremeum HHB9708]
MSDRTLLGSFSEYVSGLCTYILFVTLQLVSCSSSTRLLGCLDRILNFGICFLTNKLNRTSDAQLPFYTWRRNLDGRVELNPRMRTPQQCSSEW